VAPRGMVCRRAGRTGRQVAVRSHPFVCGRRTGCVSHDADRALRAGAARFGYAARAAETRSTSSAEDCSRVAYVPVRLGLEVLRSGNGPIVFTVSSVAEGDRARAAKVACVIVGETDVDLVPAIGELGLPGGRQRSGRGWPTLKRELAVPGSRTSCASRYLRCSQAVTRSGSSPGQPSPPSSVSRSARSAKRTPTCSCAIARADQCLRPRTRVRDATREESQPTEDSLRLRLEACHRVERAAAAHPLSQESRSR